MKIKHANQLETAQNVILDPTKISRYTVAADDVYSSDGYYMEVPPGSLSSSHMRCENDTTLLGLSVYHVPGLQLLSQYEKRGEGLEGFIT